MTIEQECFATYFPQKKRLLAYGFVPVPEGFLYETPFFDGQFYARILVSGKGEVSGEVFDADTDEIYDPIRSEARDGAFVNLVRNAYREILEDIAHNCCMKSMFRSMQANRMAIYLANVYGEYADRPFSDRENGAVFRADGSQRWYALVMHVQAGKIPGWDLGDENETVEIVNLKADPEKRESLIAKKGVFPAYHMNHEKWISVLLDGPVTDRELAEMLLDSRQQVMKGNRNGKGLKKNWIIPANPAYYPIQNAFDHTDTIYWKQSSDIRPGDTVFLYVGQPYSCVMYRCEAIETDLPGVKWSDRVRVRSRMKLRLKERYPEGKYTFSWLGTVGIRAVRGPRGVTQEFLDAIAEQ